MCGKVIDKILGQSKSVQLSKNKVELEKIRLTEYEFLELPKHEILMPNTRKGSGSSELVKIMEEDFNSVVQSVFERNVAKGTNWEPCKKKP